MKETPNFGMALGQVIREHREKRNLARSNLAEKIGGSISHIKAIEVGNRNPTITTFVLIAEAFDLEPDVLLREVRQKQAFLNQKK